MQNRQVQIKYKRLPVTYVSDGGDGYTPEPAGNIFFLLDDAVKQEIILADLLKQKMDVTLVNDQTINHVVELQALSQDDVCSFSGRLMYTELDNIEKLTSGIQCEETSVAELFKASFVASKDVDHAVEPPRYRRFNF